MGDENGETQMHVPAQNMSDSSNESNRNSDKSKEPVGDCNGYNWNLLGMDPLGQSFQTWRI